MRIVLRDSARTSRADLAVGRSRPRVQALVDGSDANTATIALGYARRRRSRRTPRDVVLRGRGDRRRPSPRESRVWYNEELASRNMIVPGLVAVIMTIIAAMLTSLTIAREWERGTMEQLAATPVRRAEVVLGKLLPYLGIGLVDVAVRSLLGILVFDVPFRGSPLLLAGCCRSASWSARSGSASSSRRVARSQLLATQMAMLATYPARVPALGLHVSHRRDAGAAAGAHATSCRRATSSW